MGVVKVDKHVSFSMATTKIHDTPVVTIQHNTKDLMVNEKEITRLTNVINHNKDGGSKYHNTMNTIKKIVLKESRRKPINVHEYYKLWRIYDLDVVY